MTGKHRMAVVFPQLQEHIFLADYIWAKLQRFQHCLFRVLNKHTPSGIVVQLLISVEQQYSVLS